MVIVRLNCIGCCVPGFDRKMDLLRCGPCQGGPGPFLESPHPEPHIQNSDNRNCNASTPPLIWIEWVRDSFNSGLIQCKSVEGLKLNESTDLNLMCPLQRINPYTDLHWMSPQLDRRALRNRDEGLLDLIAERSYDRYSRVHLFDQFVPDEVWQWLILSRCVCVMSRSSDHEYSPGWDRRALRNRAVFLISRAAQVLSHPTCFQSRLQESLST